MTLTYASTYNFISASVFWSISFKTAAPQNVTEHMLTQKSVEVHCVWLYNKY